MADITIVGWNIYVLNVSQGWRSGRPGILMGDFNVGCEADQVTSPHSLVDALK